MEERERLLWAIAFLIRNQGEALGLGMEGIERSTRLALRNLMEAGLLTDEEAEEVERIVLSHTAEELISGIERGAPPQAPSLPSSER